MTARGRVSKPTFMSVHIVADTAAKLSTLRAVLEGRHAVTSELLGGANGGSDGSDALVIATDLRIVEKISALRELFRTLGYVRKRIFLVDQRARCSPFRLMLWGRREHLLVLLIRRVVGGADRWDPSGDRLERGFAWRSRSCDGGRDCSSHRCSPPS